MKMLISILASLSLITCSVRKTAQQETNLADSAGSSTEESLAPAAPPGIPIQNMPVEPTPESTEEIIKFDFVEVSFQDIDGFDAPSFTIKAPQDSTIKSNELKVSYKICPLNPDTGLPDILKNCIEGYNRDLQFILPVFTQEFSVHLELCDEKICYNKADKNISRDKNGKRFVSSESDKDEIQLASRFIEQEQRKQEFFSTVSRIYEKIQSLLKFSQECKNTITEKERASLKTLAGFSKKALESAFFNLQLKDLESFLTQDFIQQMEKEMSTLASVAEGLKSFDGLFNHLVMVVGGLTGAAIMVKEQLELKEWNKYVKDQRTLKEGGKESILYVHRETGFLVKKEDLRCKRGDSCTFYVEDPQSKILLRGGDSKHSLLTIDPYEFVKNAEPAGSAKKVGVKYYKGHFYQYDYDTKAFSYETREGIPMSGNRKVDELIGRSFRKEFALKRDGAALAKDPNSKSFHPEDFETRASLNVKGQSFVDMNQYLKQSKFLRHPLFQEELHLGLKLPKTVLLQIRPIIAAALAGTSALIVALDYNNVTIKLDEASDKSTCTKGISLKDDMTKIAEIRTQIALTNIEIIDALGHPIYTVPNSTVGLK